MMSVTMLHICLSAQGRPFQLPFPRHCREQAKRATYLPKLHPVKMEKRWLFSLFCLLSVPSVAGQPEDVITQTEVVRALPGADVTLVCSFPKRHTTYIIQTQWSKTDDNQLTRIAVYHPVYGTHYFTFPEASYNFSVSFSMRKCCDWDATEALCFRDPNAKSECNRWALHLKNVTVSLSGQYECSFATYPCGTKAAKIQLLVKAEEEQHYVKEVQLNQTLEIPCVEDTTSENLSNYPLKWLVGENGRREELVTKEPSCPAVYRNSSMLDGQRVRLGLNYTLKIFPTKITDDGKVFSCHVAYHPERVQKSSTTVRVFAYPEISVRLQEGSAGTTQKPNVSCVVRKVFPKPSLVWYVDRASLTEQPGEIAVEQEDLQDSEGFYQLRSTLVLQGTQQAHKIFSCACLFSFLGNETRNISSEEIFVSFNLGNSALPSAVVATSEHQSTSLASPDFTSQASLAPASTTQGALISTAEVKSYTSPTAFSESLTTAHLNDSTTKSLQSLRNATRSSENTTLVYRNLSFSVTDQPISVTRGKDFFTTSSLLNSTGGVRNAKDSRFPWPTVVAVLLLFCSFLIALGIRKWCQYQKEIMNRPPSFKPPPPPIKYTSMVESDGTPPSCHELENL
ncbi:PREDICTED: T-cell surface protein tactile [Haliaeetus leucocephalus]|uniref:T-cell surface protein tactile n=1 Tax=Haliaeetus leucocephalus TaxID=52644 RepID=UPI00053CAB1F|nr:PREDICTED: T-cell surface protein tactile [Haliaeetus leucocephalus]